ncbi:MAG: phosphatidate cytidylyltransferase [Acidimicrobiales bacterium]
MSERNERPDAEPVPAGEGVTDQTASLARGRTTTGAHARIEGVEAGVAAGYGVPVEAVGQADEEDPVPQWPVQLPDWRDPPTHQVPRVLLDPSADEERSVPGPVWREVESDWHHDDLTFADIVSEGSAVPEHGGLAEPDPYGFDFVFTEAAPSQPAPQPAEVTANGEVPPAADEPPGPLTLKTKVSRRLRQASRHPADPGQAAQRPPRHESRPRHAATASRSRRSPAVATITGLVAGFLVLVCLKAGPPYMLALTTIVLTVALAECYQALRTVRLRPAVLIGLLGVPACVLSAYFAGPASIPIVTAGVVIATLSWFLLGISRRSRLVNISATIGAWAWIGLLGSFAGLVLSPRLFPDRHGAIYLLAVIEVTVAYDVGAYAFGSWLGQHKLAPSISPNKTIEGLVGGSFVAIALAVGLVTHQHPWTFWHALWLGVIVAVLAPLGDLVESMVKRDIGVKDMGTLLPAHGGALDRIDALLFVIPATYCLMRLFHG